MKLLIDIIFIAAVIMLAGGCSSPDHSAAYTDANRSLKISIQLYATHPYLAEYDRSVNVAYLDHDFPALRLARDTGGYAAVNLYRCNQNAYMLDSYGEHVTIFLDKEQMVPGRCDEQPEYLGIFDSGGSMPWQFFPASARPEQRLEMRGG